METRPLPGEVLVFRKVCLVALFGWMFLCAERNPFARVVGTEPLPATITQVIVMEVPVL